MWAGQTSQRPCKMICNSKCHVVMFLLRTISVLYMPVVMLVLLQAETPWTSMNYILYNYIGLLFLVAVSFIQVINNYGQTCGEEPLHSTEMQLSTSLQNRFKIAPSKAWSDTHLPNCIRFWETSEGAEGVGGFSGFYWGWIFDQRQADGFSHTMLGFYIRCIEW